MKTDRSRIADIGVMGEVMDRTVSTEGRHRHWKLKQKSVRKDSQVSLFRSPLAEFISPHLSH